MINGHSDFDVKTRKKFSQMRSVLQTAFSVLVCMREETEKRLASWGRNETSPDLHRKLGKES